MIKVLAFPAFKNKSSNPYNSLIYEGIKKENVLVEEFSFKRCMKLDFDIIHIHWPEIYLNSHYRIKAMFNILMLILCMKWAKFKKKKVVWTVHNLKPHEVKYPTLNKILWKYFLPMVDKKISLSEANVKIIDHNFGGPNKAEVIYHGLYTDSYENKITRKAAREELGIEHAASVCLFFGQVKKYKNVERLIGIYINCKVDELLLIVGRFESVVYYNEIKKMIKGYRNIILINEFVDNDDIQLYFNASNVCVIPFKEIFNSGSALLSVSFNLPVLIPESESFKEYSYLVPTGMINLYSNELCKDDIINTMSIVIPSDSITVDEKITWLTISKQHADLYRRLNRIYD